MREGFRQIGKPTFDLPQALNRLLRSHAPQTTDSANFCALATSQRWPVNVRKFWRQLPKNIPLGNVWQTNSPTEMERGFINLGYFHWALSMFICFRFMSGLLCSFCRWPESQNIISSRRLAQLVGFLYAFEWISRLRSAFIFFRSRHPLQYVLSHFTRSGSSVRARAALCHLSIFKNIIHITLSVFLKQWICIEHWI